MRADVRAALLFALWHHQGGSSPVGQPIREILGIGRFDRLSDADIDAAKSFAPPPVEAKQQGPGEATDADIAAWLERHDLDHAIRGTDARAAFEDAQTFHMTQAPQVEAKRQTGEAESYALQAALSWINERGHGENCYLDPDHDLGKQCVCGKEAVVTLIEEASAAATNGKGG